MARSQPLKDSWRIRLAWLVLIWAASVTTGAAVAVAMRVLMQVAGLA